MVNRRRFLQAGSAALLSLAGPPLLAPLVCARDPDIRDKLPDGSAAKDMITPACQQAIDAGLAFLAQNQHANGSFGTQGYQGNVAITSLGALAMMSGGHQPGRGKYGKVVQDALEYVLSQEKNSPPGYLTTAEHGQFGGRPGGHGPMYGHGFGTLFLAEVYGMVHNKDLRERLHDTLKRAVELIIRYQNNQGGWRYKPGDNDADISVTICQIMALRAARNAGFAVPKKTADKCVEYVKNCQNRGPGEQRGSFRYMISPNQGPNPIAFARTAAGVVALYSAGIYKGVEVEEGLNYLRRWKRGQENGNRAYSMPFRGPDIHYFYGHYYAVQAMWTAGGDWWAEWFPYVREELLTHSNRRAPDGSWHDNICGHYATAMACIILQVPNNYLPILQK